MLPAGIDLVVATQADRPLLERLLQLYEYDYSEYAGVDVDERGLFPTLDAGELLEPEPDYHVFLIRVDGQVAGFACVTRHESYVELGESYLVDEFLVLRKYRRRGVGERVARTLFDRFPGRWDVGTVPGNRVAQAFWRRVIDRYTGDDFRELPDAGERWAGPIWSFESRPPPR